MKRILAFVLAFSMMLTACGSESSGYKAGTYTSTVDGHNAPITVEVTFTDSAIETVVVKEHSETLGLSDPALERVPADIVKYQSLAVDTVAGATVTSNAVIAAVEDAATQAGGDIAALKAEIKKDEVAKTEKEVTTDVLVVGSGISGLSAAISASNAGADVIVIEKMPVTGGTSAIAGGFLISVESAMETEGVDDSLATFRNYWEGRMAVSGVESGYPDYDRWEDVISLTGPTADWLIEEGVGFTPQLMQVFGPYPIVMHPNGGRGMIDDMVKVAQDKGAQVVTECKANELIIEDGAVVGVKAETAAEIITYKAKSVVLATGGFSANDEMVKKYSPKVANAMTISTAAAGSTGDGMTMAIDAGAKVFEKAFTSICATTIDPEFAAVADVSAFTDGTQLGVDADGVRIGNELVGLNDRDALGSAMIQAENPPYWFIYDSSNAALVAEMEKGVAAGVVAKGETIEELAKAMGTDVDTFTKTYTDYTGFVANGEDTQFGKPADALLPIETAPYYAVKYYPTTFGSQGGVETTLEGAVLNTEGEVIPGLYAVGEMSNRYYYNENYVLAASLGIYATAGNLCGTAAGTYAIG